MYGLSFLRVVYMKILIHVFAHKDLAWDYQVSRSRVNAYHYYVLSKRFIKLWSATLVIIHYW